MRQRSQRYEIYASGGNRGQARGVAANVAGSLDQHTGSATAHQFYRPAHHFYIHIVKQDDIRTRCKRLLYLCLRFALDLDFEQVGSQAAGGSDGRRDSSCSLDVIILDENAIAQAKTVVVTATGAHGVFFQAAQPWCRLTRIEDVRSRALDGADTARGDGGDAAEAAKKIQGDAFGTEQRASRTAKVCQDLTWLYDRSILHQ